MNNIYMIKKTNIRLNNYYLLYANNKYYLSDIDLLKDWKDFKSTELKKFLKNNDCTEKINELIKKYDVSSNVNFILDDFKLYSASLKKTDTKVIKLDSKVKEGGG